MKEPTIKELEKRMDVLCQTVCRCKGARKIGEDYLTNCVTCGKACPCFGKDCIQGGHFIPRGCRVTRWEYGNVYPQCNRCNGFLAGNYIEYSLYMSTQHPEDYKGLINLYELHKKGQAPHRSLLERKTMYNSWLHKGRELEKKTGKKLFPKSWDYVIV